MIGVGSDVSIWVRFYDLFSSELTLKNAYNDVVLCQLYIYHSLEILSMYVVLLDLYNSLNSSLISLPHCRLFFRVRSSTRNRFVFDLVVCLRQRFIFFAEDKKKKKKKFFFQLITWTKNISVFFELKASIRNIEKFKKKKDQKKASPTSEFSNWLFDVGLVGKCCLVEAVSWVILEVSHVSLLYSSKNEVTFKIIIWSKLNSDQSQVQWWF
jgi:hypothetical protein